MSFMPAPLDCEFDGVVLRPLDTARAKERLREGQRYQIEIVETRSGESHRHYFACIHTAWLNLPDSERARHPTTEHLRAWALIKAGYYTERAWICGTPAEALRIKSLAETLDEFAVVVMQGNVVAVFRGKSQSYKAMGKQTFEESKQAVIAVCAGLIGVTPDELAANAGTAA